jgi:redox-sensitive bicupin YhaK (pirin superfamily)
MSKRIRRIPPSPAPHWVGDGFPVRSLFSYREAEEFDPFLLLDYAAPYEFGPATAVRGVGEHPHRGFETVTIVYQGELEHRDSSGGHGTIGPGDVQWMTAASGIVHEEFQSERFTREGGVLEMVQLWVNLPARDKKAAPRYQEILASSIPAVALPGEAGQARVVAGEFLGVQGPAKTVTPLAVVDLRLKPERAAVLPVPAGHTTLLVVQRGEIVVNDTERAGEMSLVQFERDGSDIRILAQSDATVLLLHGLPIGEPVAAQGPFVMNTQEDIRESIQAYQSGRMGRLN